MSRKMLKLTHLILGLALILGLFGPAWGAADLAEAKAHPLLVQMATEDPEQPVAVIVQKLAKEADFAPLVAQLGGEITKDLHIINAFAAELSAEAALKLARNEGVRWVSLDAPVEQSSIYTIFKLRDEFSGRNYTGNNGSVSWSGPWMEIGEADGPSAGLLQVVRSSACLRNCMQIGGKAVDMAGKGISRSFDLSGAAD